MSRRREKEAGHAMSLACRRCMGRFDRGRWLQDLSRIKTRRTPSLPNWLLFPSNFPTRAQQTRQHSCPTRNQPVPDLPLLLLAASCCSHPSWPCCPLIRHNSTTVALSLLLSLPQAKPATWKDLFHHAPEDHLLYGSNYLAARLQFAPRITSATRNSGTREPPLLP